jgi:hypothetical protein
MNRPETNSMRIGSGALSVEKPALLRGQNVLRRPVTAARREECSALEIGNLAARSCWGFPVVSLPADTRQMQEGMVFGS